MFTFARLAVLLLALAGCSTQMHTPAEPFARLKAGAVPEMTCVEGEELFYTQDRFAIDHTLVEFGPGVAQVIAGAGGAKAAYGDYSYPLHTAAQAGKVERFRGTQAQRVYLNNVTDTALIPDYVLVKFGRGYCAGLAKITRLGKHALEVLIPIRSGTGLGQGGVVFPRAPLAVRELVVCTTSSVDILFAPEITKGMLKGMKNTLCDVQNHAGDRAIQGKGGVLFGIIAAARAKNVDSADSADADGP